MGEMIEIGKIYALAEVLARRLGNEKAGAAFSALVIEEERDFQETLHELNVRIKGVSSALDSGSLEGTKGAVFKLFEVRDSLYELSTIIKSADSELRLFIREYAHLMPDKDL